jgi:hypothetical protein
VDLVVHEVESFNAETCPDASLHPLTATRAFFVRGHGASPEIEPSRWRARGGGCGCMGWWSGHAYRSRDAGAK